MKTVDFSDILQPVTLRQLSEFMKVCKYGISLP